MQQGVVLGPSRPMIIHWSKEDTPYGRKSRTGGRYEVNKGARGMPRLSEAKKDVTSCEKLWGSAQAK
jgi:hypothetical protein